MVAHKILSGPVTIYSPAFDANGFTKLELIARCFGGSNDELELEVSPDDVHWQRQTGPSRCNDEGAQIDVVAR